METVALIIAIIFFIAGLIGTVLPVLPGAILILSGMLIYGLMTGFAELNAFFYILQVLVVVIVFLVDYLASAAGTKYFGGSRQAAWGAIIGTIAGIILLGPLGLIIGPFCGSVLTELVRGVKIRPALKAGLGTLVGALGGTLLKIVAEALMIVYFFMRIW